VKAACRGVHTENAWSRCFALAQHRETQFHDLDALIEIDQRRNLFPGQ
jgi:hypothetical protein